jgi:DNA-binding transcriptional LysR family regulator
MTVFARVAATRSFSGAARELGISQATASKHVQMLENWVGIRLLNRTTRHVGLTEAGRDFYVQVTRILEDMETARHAGRGIPTLRGTLRATIPAGFGDSRLAAILLDFMHGNPELTVSVTVCHRPMDLIEEDYDLAIRAWHRPPDDPGLTIQPLMPLRHVICAAPAYMEAHGAPAGPEALCRMDCLTDSEDCGGVWRLAGPDGETEVAVNGRFQSSSAALRRAAALAGAGILLIPEILVEGDLAAGRLVRLLPDYRLTMRLDAVAPTHRATAPKVRQCVAFLAARLRGQ